MADESANWRGRTRRRSPLAR